jgi:hypothetical protein
LPRSAEPRILAEDVQGILVTLIDPENPDSGEAVQRFALRAGVSTRTIYRVLSGQAGTTTTPASLALRVADQLVTAAGLHLSDTRALTPDGQVVPYLEAP